MITINGKIKCDACGKFISQHDWKKTFIPDSYYTKEEIEDFDSECFKNIKNNKINGGLE